MAFCGHEVDSSRVDGLGLDSGAAKNEVFFAEGVADSFSHLAAAGILFIDKDNLNTDLMPTIRRVVAEKQTPV